MNRIAQTQDCKLIVSRKPSHVPIPGTLKCYAISCCESNSTHTHASSEPRVAMMPAWCTNPTRKQKSGPCEGCSGRNKRKVTRATRSEPADANPAGLFVLSGTVIASVLRAVNTPAKESRLQERRKSCAFNRLPHCDSRQFRVRPGMASSHHLPTITRRLRDFPSRRVCLSGGAASRPPPIPSR